MSHAQPAPTASGGWVGRPVDAFIVAKGVPQVRQGIGGGRTVYEWTSVHGVARGGGMVGALLELGGTPVQAGSLQLTCKIRMITNGAGRIEQFRIVTDTVGLWGTSRCAEVLN